MRMTSSSAPLSFVARLRITKWIRPQPIEGFQLKHFATNSSSYQTLTAHRGHFTAVSARPRYLAKDAFNSCRRQNEA
jgi:hypothetical protein